MSEREKLIRLTDALVEDILETPADEILKEFEEDYGKDKTEQIVTEMRGLIKSAIDKANEPQVFICKVNKVTFHPVGKEG
jgi:hypothetical protein